MCSIGESNVLCVMQWLESGVMKDLDLSVEKEEGMFGSSMYNTCDMVKVIVTMVTQ